jgi:hypothetical protein
MVDQKVLPVVLRRLLDAGEKDPAGKQRFQVHDMDEALRYVGAYDAQWMERNQWLADAGYVKMESSIWLALTKEGRRLADTV